MLVSVLAMAPLVVFAGPYSDPITSQDMNFPWWMKVFSTLIIIFLVLFVIGILVKIADKLRGK